LIAIVFKDKRKFEDDFMEDNEIVKKNKLSDDKKYGKILCYFILIL